VSETALAAPAMPAATATRSPRLLGAALIGAPTLLFASTLASAVGGGLNADHTGGALQVYAFAAWSLVVVGLTRIIEGPLPRAAAALLAIGALGVAGGVANGLDSIQFAETGVTSEDAGAAGVFALNITGALFPLAMLGLGVALVRARVEPRWSGFALAAAAILFPVSRISSNELLALAADAVFLVALAPLGWAILQGPTSAPAAATRSASPVAAGP
jgi:hypothetical protein